MGSKGEVKRYPNEVLICHKDALKLLKKFCLTANSLKVNLTTESERERVIEAVESSFTGDKFCGKKQAREGENQRGVKGAKTFGTTA